jgi:hypothetical protein
MSAGPRPTARSNRGLRLLLLLAIVVVVVQQQLLWRRPPRLLELSQAAASSGPAALSLRFSRPMEAGSIAAATRLEPPLPFTIQGEGNPLLLLPAAGLRIETPVTVRLGGRDRRGLVLPASQWHWDPRPHLVAVVPARGGEQVRVRQHDGRWTSLTPVWPSIPVLEPLGDGSGLALVSRDETGGHRVWRLDLSGTSLSRNPQGLAVVGRRRLERLSDEPLVFAHLSSNRLGDLLVQAARLPPLGDTLVLHERGGRQQPLPLETQGPVALLPQGGAAIVPEPEGLALRTLPPRPERRQVLPGSRDLSSFCPVAGRALLVRHWPDFRRSLELVEPGQAPRPLWIGSEGLVASACSRGGERVWALLIDGLARPRLSLLALDRRGRLLQRRELEGWELEPGTGLHYDPTGDRLLLALRPLPGPDATEEQLRRSRQEEARPALIDATTLRLELLDQPVRQVQWLKAG